MENYLSLGPTSCMYFLFNYDKCLGADVFILGASFSNF